MEPKNREEPPGLYYGWIVVGASCLLSLSYGMFYSFGVYLKPLQEEFIASRSLISSIQSVHLIVLGLSSIIMGRITDKYSPRIAIFLGAILAGTGFFLCSRATNIFQFYIFYIIASLGSGSVWSPPLATVQRWFVRRRGLVVGITSAGMGLGMLVYAPFCNYLMSNYGWRISFLVAGGCTTLILLITSFLIYRTPEDKGLTPYGYNSLATGVRANSEADMGEAPVWNTRDAIKSWSFAGIAFLYTATVLPISLLGVHLVAYATDHGIDTALAASAFGLVGAFSVAGRIAVPVYADRAGWLRSVAVCCGACAFMLIWLIFTSSSWMLYVFVILYGFFYGGKVPLIPGLVGIFFGLKALGEITAILHSVSMIFSAAGPFIGGWIFDMTGNYVAAFIFCTVMWAIAAAVAMLLKPPANKGVSSSSVNATMMK